MRRPKHRARRRTRSSPRSSGSRSSLCGQIGILAVQAAPPVDSPGPPSADGVQPVIADTQSSNDDCGQLGFDHGISIAGNGQVSSGAIDRHGHRTTTARRDSWTGPRTSRSTASTPRAVPAAATCSITRRATPATRTCTRHRSPTAATTGESSRALLERRRDRARRLDHQGERPAGSVLHGASITYTLTVTNGGTATATRWKSRTSSPRGSRSSPPPRDATRLPASSRARWATSAPARLSRRHHVSVDDTSAARSSNVAHVSASNETGGATENNDSNEVSNSVECSEQPSPPTFR